VREAAGRGVVLGMTPALKTGKEPVLGKLSTDIQA
jgi:hypothetical protein